MYLNLIYALVIHCMIELRPDLESTHQVGHFCIWFIQIGQIEADINQFNILELGCIYLSGCSLFEQVGTGQNWFLVHVRWTESGIAWLITFLFGLQQERL